MAAPLPAKEGDRDARASPARSSSRGLAEPAGARSSPTAQVAPEVHTYGSSPVSSSGLRPNLKPESRLEGSTSGSLEAEGASAVRLGAGADPREISLVLSFFVIGGKLPPPCSTPLFLRDD